jgi:hypothetical protein
MQVGFMSGEIVHFLKISLRFFTRDEANISSE